MTAIAEVKQGRELMEPMSSSLEMSPSLTSKQCGRRRHGRDVTKICSVVRMRAPAAAEMRENLRMVPSIRSIRRRFSYLGDRKRAIQALVRAIPEGPFRIGRELEAPEFALLRGDPRVKTLRKKVGLPE